MYLERYGFKKDYATKCLNNNKHNQVTTVYYLLLQRLVKQGKLSSTFKVQKTPNKQKQKDFDDNTACADFNANRINENQVQINSKDNRCESPSRSPEKRKRNLDSFENMINIKTSVPRKSHVKDVDEYSG